MVSVHFACVAYDHPFAVLLPAAALVREKERGTVEQLLVSPVSPFSDHVFESARHVGVILLATALALYGVLHLVFHVPMKGSAGLFFC